MKTQMNNRSGFTLIEIIVVLIIVGILAAIALPNLFQNVTKSRAAEALTSMGTYKSDIEGCAQAHLSNLGECSTLAGVGIPTSTSSNFTYGYTGPSTTDNGTDLTWSMTATYTGNNSDMITMSRDSTGTVICTGSSDFTGVC